MSPNRNRKWTDRMKQLSYDNCSYINIRSIFMKAYIDKLMNMHTHNVNNVQYTIKTMVHDTEGLHILPLY